MEPIRAVRTATLLGAAVTFGGLGMALVYSASEALAHPGYSLADGYWLGALPWMGFVEAFVVGGATASILAGTATVAVLGGWARRLSTFALAAISAFWWFAAWLGAGFSGALCTDCPPRAFDPWAYAYSAPILALLMLIVPAAVVTFLALGRRTPG